MPWDDNLPLFILTQILFLKPRKIFSLTQPGHLGSQTDPPERNQNDHFLLWARPALAACLRSCLSARLLGRCILSVHTHFQAVQRARCCFLFSFLFMQLKSSPSPGAAMTAVSQIEFAVPSSLHRCCANTVLLKTCLRSSTAHPCVPRPREVRVEKLTFLHAHSCRAAGTGLVRSRKGSSLLKCPRVRLHERGVVAK